jgi:hypothetical protein
LLLHFFHGGNTGSNPVGDANKIKNFRETTAFLHGPIWSSYFEAVFFRTIFTSLLCASRFCGLTGGIGFSEPLYRACDTLLNRTLELITACPCENGCPSCVGPTADRSERTKEVALEILGRMSGDTQFLPAQTEETA